MGGGAAFTLLGAIMSASPAPLRPCRFDELEHAAGGPVRWLWHGYLASGAITLLTSRWKAGKTTLLSVLLNRLHTDGTLAGNAVEPGPALVVSEESPALWVERGRRLDFGPRAQWLCRPFVRKPSAEQWHGLIAELVRSAESGGLVVIDPLAAFLPGADENNASAMLDALAPLHALTNHGAAVLLLHHP